VLLEPATQCWVVTQGADRASPRVRVVAASLAA
jgi:hypothetical protein